MPKKIKKHKETKLKGNKEKILNVNNIHYVSLAVLLIVIAVCIGVGVYIYSNDGYHVHKDQAIASFTYTEKVDEGYNVYTINEMEDKNIYTVIDTPTSSVQNKWGRNKFLDFNEELYLSGILDNESQVKVENIDPKWSLEIEFIDGSSRYYSSESGFEIDKKQFADVMLKYFKQEILYK